MKAITENLFTCFGIAICSILFSSPIISIAIIAISQDEALRAYGVVLLAFSCSIIGYVAGKQGMFDKR